MPDSEADNHSETRQERRERKLKKKQQRTHSARQKPGENLP
jgi:hypothetical protein